MGSLGIESYRQLEPNTLVESLIAYVEKQLPLFTKSGEFVEILEIKKNENQHSAAFCAFMTNQCRSKFYFNRENAQKGSSSIDIGVYKGGKLFFTIEAKILPTPKGSHRNEYEYVYGRGGGIQRFRNGSHGLDNSNNYLNQNGLIAYVKEFDFPYWVEKINQWIADAEWDEAEKLQGLYLKSIGRLKSEHPRSDDSKVFLDHFWVYVNEEEDSSNE